MHSSTRKSLFALILLLSTAAAAQPASALQAQDEAEANNKAAAKAGPAEDISGMYSFLREGEFVQINREQNGVSGYISRQGDLESDRGAYLDQFFEKASIEGHDVSFTTRPLHGVVFEFKGRYERGEAKNKTSDGYYILRGTLTEVTNSDKKTARSREVAFKLLAQPPEESEGGKDKE